ncbi:tetratricopeptide repeat protein 39B-like isoform X2 [Photinus pyralis]|nr:tetratricopeptide repeat protein 39B-like isoform X2 [Photinus pyralis]
MAADDTSIDADFDEFQDACDVSPVPEGMTFEKSMEEAQLAINYFFNNQFEEAIELMRPFANSSLYHSIGYSVFVYLEALLTFEHQAVVRAVEQLKKCIAVCNRFRRKNTITESFGKMVKKVNYEQYTDVEAHAELCYAECLLLRSMLSFMEDETLSSLIKAGFKIRSCYGSYKECQNILINRDWQNCATKPHFEGGVRMGIGAFNLMISLLPSRIIKLLEFIGFSGNKELGLQDLEKGYRMGGLRKILCVMTLLGYNSIVLQVLSHGEGDLAICEDILDNFLKMHPDGVWFLFFKGRLEFMKANIDECIGWYTRAWKSQEKWPQFHHMCFWELTWVHCMRTQWKEALVYATHLLEGSRWSRTIYSYQKAVLLYMMRGELSVSDRMVTDNLMKELPNYKQRIAGKSLPMEKFVIKKSERYFSQNQTLVLPVLELMYLWNLFKVLGKQFTLAENVFKLIEKAESELTNFKVRKYHADNTALVLLLKGACLRQMNSPLQALECLENAISMLKDIQEDHYIVPYAIVELALIEWEQNNREKAIAALEDAKKNYTGYSLESRLHFRIHTALTAFKSYEAEHTKL